MKTIAIIPARMGSSRFPGKPMEKILGMPMIGHVLLRTKMSSHVDEVYVATCDQVIADYINSIGGKAIMTRNTHERCTERTAEAVSKIEKELGYKVEIVLMLQGDEPMVTPRMIDLALTTLRDEKLAKAVNLMTELETRDEQENTNEIKVVVDKNSYALYFSREAIPTPKRGSLLKPAMKQVCVIPFQRDFLFEYVTWEPGFLEIAESVDMNRILENGEKIKMAYCSEKTHAVDIPSDIDKVEKAMKNDEFFKKYEQCVQ